MMTGGTPVRRMKGVAVERSQPGALGQAATAPISVPMTKLRTVVTSNSPIVQGKDCAITSVTVMG